MCWSRESSDGLVMVDGGSAAHSKALLKTIEKQFGGRPVRTLFNTHWHAEQTGSNLALARKGATIVSHANTRLWLSTDVQMAVVRSGVPASARRGPTDQDFLRA